MTTSTTFSSRLYEFWFRPISAAGFGMMRSAFGGIAFFTMLLEVQNMQRFYGSEGILPHHMIGEAMRLSWRFSLLDYVGGTSLWLLYIILLVSLFCVMTGIGRKKVFLLALALLYSFHEYGFLTLDGGDTLLRLIGFILLLSPCYKTFTVTNLWLRFQLIRETGKDQPASVRTMPVWPYRLLLWQMILIYVSSAIEKLSGNTWRDGSAVAIVLHHSDFTRLTPWMADRLSFMSPIIGYFTVFSQLAWAMILILGLLTFVHILSSREINLLKRKLLLCGILLHGSIFLFMDIGTFSFTVFAAYLGLLLDDDFQAIRARLNRNMKAPCIVLYDGRCGFCKKSMFILSVLDFLHRLEFANFHDANLKKKYANNISASDLNTAMHVRLPDGSYQKGFFAFRTITASIPAFWILRPLLFLPGIPFIGTRVYAWVAAHR